MFSKIFSTDQMMVLFSPLADAKVFADAKECHEIVLDCYILDCILVLQFLFLWLGLSVQTPNCASRCVRGLQVRLRSSGLALFLAFQWVSSFLCVLVGWFFSWHFGGGFTTFQWLSSLLCVLVGQFLSLFFFFLAFSWVRAFLDTNWCKRLSQCYRSARVLAC